MMNTVRKLLGACITLIGLPFTLIGFGLVKVGHIVAHGTPTANREIERIKKRYLGSA